VLNKVFEVREVGAIVGEEVGPKVGNPAGDLEGSLVGIFRRRSWSLSRNRGWFSWASRR
jgi:hypothetical protein